MNVTALLADLAAAGVDLSAEGDRLRYRAPAGTMPPGRVALLRAHKADILRWLADPDGLRVAMALAIFDAEPAPDTPPVTPLRCFACGTALDERGLVCGTCHPPAGDRAVSGQTGGGEACGSDVRLREPELGAGAGRVAPPRAAGAPKGRLR